MANYLISIASDNQSGAEWGKRRFYDDNSAIYKLYQGLDQLNALFDSELDLNSKEFLDAVKSEIKKLVENSAYKSAYKEKLALLDDRQFKFVIVDDVKQHGTSVYKKGIELVNCDEFAHIDEINTTASIDGLVKMNRLYICDKNITTAIFINHNFPTDLREISIPNYNSDSNGKATAFFNNYANEKTVT